MLECALFINGERRAPAGGQWHDVKDPADGTLVGRTALADAADVDIAVAAAKNAAPAWADTHADERARILQRAADLIEARIDDIATLLTREQGKPLPDSRKETEFGIKVLRYYAEEGRRIGGSLRPSASSDVKNVVSYHPVGVVAAIVPWNYPVDLYCWKIGPALAAGCPIIVKPPHETPFAIDRVVDCLIEAGLPNGVLANLPGTGPTAGQALSEHPGIACISATASIAAGQDIMRRAAVNLKRISLELGGHAPFIVMPDADIEVAAKAAMRRSFSNMGQICITVNRILTHERVHDEFLDALAAETRAIELGRGLDPGVAYGPVTNESVIYRVQAHIDDAVRKGATIVCGGEPATEGDLARGHFFKPTLIDNASLDSLPMREETYGPLAAVRSCRTIDEVLRISNSLRFGLAAYVYSEDLERAWALADRLEFGGVGINVSDTSELQAPFGGWKLSGIGRELGIEGLETFLEPKHVRIRVTPYRLG
jgi:succinate-semialdehyde dehydrogenase / glutarate-semialdehyde dehydrogenase